jgi:DNA anti-recombination protein RmuC
LYKRFATWSEHYENVGNTLGVMNNHYNKSVGSYKRLNSQIKTLEDLRINEDLGKTAQTLKVTNAEIRALPETIDLEDE